ncbi:MAG: MogA/MoaB family molybdenum cofactor biosynthesis protein [Eubacteriaceae bacterium]|nr:MogA/MoaB family molybdenum cofactor biosynthesis protein [Eubacteriaceae bacterium]
MRKVAIITSSDTGYRGERTDESGPVIKSIVEGAGYEVVHYVILPDEKEMLAAEMARIADEKIAQLIITTGGTGFSPRDVMPEATKSITEREVPGIPEAMRAFSMRYTKRTMLSRAAAGIRKSTLIINLPGSPKACRENLEYIIEELEHGLGILLEEEKNCAVKD